VVDGRRDSGRTKTPANTALVERQLLSGRSGDRFWGQIASGLVPLARLYIRKDVVPPPLNPLRIREGLRLRDGAYWTGNTAQIGTAAHVPHRALARLTLRPLSGERLRLRRGAYQPNRSLRESSEPPWRGIEPASAAATTA
jgi:hypothetical protein